MSGAAVYRTNRGDLEALFLPKPQSFEGLEIIEERKNGRYLYSFRGNPLPSLESPIDSSRPMYFIRQSNPVVGHLGGCSACGELRPGSELKLRHQSKLLSMDLRPTRQ